MRQHLINFVILVCCSLFLLRSLFHSGFMFTHDSLWHVERIQNIASLLPTQFPVRWSPTLDNGYGAPLFNFIYPAPYYLGGTLMLLGLGPIKAYNLIILIAYLAGGLGVYLLGSKRPWIGLAASLLYLTTPYLFLDIFVRGALGEVVALGIIPWIFLAAKELSKSGKLRWFTPLPFALLLLSHNFYAYLFGILLGFFVLVLYPHKRAHFISFLLSLGISAFFWIPALLEKQYLLFSQSLQTGYRDHFVYFSQLLHGEWNYLGSQTGSDPSEMSYMLGLSALIILVSAIVIMLKSSTTRLGWYLFAALSSIFLMLPPSDFLWQYLPLLATIQFPWRFLGVVAVLIPLIYLELSTRFATNKLFVIGSTILVVISFVTAIGYGFPQKWLTAKEFYDLHYEYVGKTTTAKREEIVPRWAAVERHLPAISLIVSNGAEVTSMQASDLGISFVATAPGVTSSAIYHRNHYPMWRLTIDGKKAPLEPTSTGEITFPLREGEHNYELRVKSTGVQLLGNTISLISIFGLSLYFYINRKRRA